MIEETVKAVREGHGVMLVAKDSKHQEKMFELLGERMGGSDIFVLRKGDSIVLTDEEVKNGSVHDYKVVIVPIKKSEGYTLTTLDTMITSVYPSNNATREQIEGRINRIGQKRDIVYKIFHTGILTYILNNHNDAKSLSLAIKAIVDVKNSI
jgi:hypothetical protein